MVSTRYQQRQEKSKNKEEESMLVEDPPLLTISRSKDSLEEQNEVAVRLDAFLEQLDDYECSTLDALVARWPSLYKRLKGMKPHLPPKKDDTRPTLVLDLDETLLHTYRGEVASKQVDYVIYAQDGHSCLLAGTLRPGVFDFLNWAANYFEVVVWTAGTEDYAAMARSCLDPEDKLITHMLTRKSCIRMRSASTKEVLYIKDLCALGRDLSKTFLIDNTPHAATLNLSNLIPIESFVGNRSDTELIELKKFLEANLVRLIDKKHDMRIILHRQFNLKRRIRERITHWRREQQSRQQ
ncbi:hypothetical protein RMATCC62417_02165 [Rhizopus microsporus]|nr:hypothetical protein RMATCC62417_02165 [Rhizopus microsporus]